VFYRTAARLFDIIVADSIGRSNLEALPDKQTRSLILPASPDAIDGDAMKPELMLTRFF
jgi:hypothetical protein